MKDIKDSGNIVDSTIASFWELDVFKTFSQEDLIKINDAYEFAKHAHASQRRKSGEPYIVHPIAVAKIVAKEFQLETDSIIAAFLHDVVEDTTYTLEDIREKFGEQVAFLVGVVTKEKKDHYEKSKQVDNFKRMLNSIHYDVRALLIKLADRLHNMRTLSSMKPDKQMKIAGETDYFYAPLANRLGMHTVRTELENLSMKYRCPDEYNSLSDNFKKYIDYNRESLKAWKKKLEDHVEKYGIKIVVNIRYRSVYSIWHKMQSQDKDFNHIPYKYVIRIVFKTDDIKKEKNIALRIYSALTDVWKEMPNSLQNYIDTPKANGYQSLHFVLLNDFGEWNGIQVFSERMIRNSKLGCIAEREGGAKAWIEKFKGVLQDMAESDFNDEYIENVTSNFYNDDIFVFTPKGNGVVLPSGSSALDLAFEIHKELGMHAHYARINKKLCSIKTKLNRGDCVDIYTDDKIMPESDWLIHVRTYKAMKNINSYLRKIKHVTTDMILCPHCNPLPGDEVIGFLENDKKHIHKRNCNEAIRKASQYGDKIIPIDFKITEELYPVTIFTTGVDRYHLLSDLVKVITEELKLSMESIETKTEDHIVESTIVFKIHSTKELKEAIARISMIENVDEVRRIL